MPVRKSTVNASSGVESTDLSGVNNAVFGTRVGEHASDLGLNVWDVYELYDESSNDTEIVEKINTAVKTALPGATRLGRYGFLSSAFASPDFTRMVTAEIRDNNLKLEGPQLYEGMMSCRRKGCTGIVRSQSRQTRAADEAIPLDNKCYKCGEHWLTG